MKQTKRRESVKQGGYARKKRLGANRRKLSWRKSEKH